MKPFLAVIVSVVMAGAGPAFSRQSQDVVPMEDWSQFNTMRYGQGSFRLHLRTGYQRPVIMPEPVSLLDGTDLAGLVVEIDTEVVIFSPADHFSSHTLSFQGLRSGESYRVEVRASALGSRIPVRLEL